MSPYFAGVVGALRQTSPGCKAGGGQPRRQDLDLNSPVVARQFRHFSMLKSIFSYIYLFIYIFFCLFKYDVTQLRRGSLKYTEKAYQFASPFTAEKVLNSRLRRPRKKESAKLQAACKSRQQLLGSESPSSPLLCISHSQNNTMMTQRNSNGNISWNAIFQLNAPAMAGGPWRPTEPGQRRPV